MAHKSQQHSLVKATITRHRAFNFDQKVQRYQHSDRQNVAVDDPYKMPFQPQLPRNQHEQAVQQAGYRWVDTVNLRPYSEDDISGPPYNRLNPHKHQSANTHLIVEGKLRLELDTGRSVTMDANTLVPNEREVPVPPEVCYKGRAGSQGTTFVEGHSILSPSTAERLESKGALRWVDDRRHQTREEWFEVERHRGAARTRHLHSVNQHGLYPNSEFDRT